MIVVVLFFMIVFSGSFIQPDVDAAEPAIADYTSYPLFMSSEVAPNIMVIMDNSGSINYPAYGVFQGTGNLVTGDNYACGNVDIPVSTVEDDAEESNYAGSITYYSNSDLDLGNFGWSDPDGDLNYDQGASPSVVVYITQISSFLSMVPRSSSMLTP